MSCIIRYIAIITALALLQTPSFATEVFYIDTDAYGTPVAMTDAQGNKVWEGQYLPFGERYKETADPEQNKIGFIGKERDIETNLSYFDARYFDDNQGRFTTVDPVAPVNPWTSETDYNYLTNPQRLNRYTYGLNNPYRYVDPDGEFVFIAAAVICAAIAYFGAPDIANAPKNSSDPTYKSHGGRNIAIGAVAGVSIVAAPELIGFIGRTISRIAPKGGLRSAPKKIGRQKNWLEPKYDADGPHSTFRRNEKGQVTTHTEWTPNPQNPKGWDPVKRVDTQYAKPHSHRNKVTGQDIPTPHTQGKNIPGGVRPATPDEIPY